MSLPQSAEYLQTPLLHYDLQNPPFIPQVKTINEVVTILPVIAAKLANEASLKASMHAARMLFYNMVSSNSWNNPYFQEAMQIATDLVIATMQRYRNRAPEQGLDDAVNQTVTGMVSLLIYTYAELKSMVGHEVLNAAEQNVHFFHNLKQELANMQNNTPGYAFYPQFQNPQVPQHPHMQHQFVPVNNGGYPVHPGNYPQHQFPHGVHANNGQMYPQYNGAPMHPTQGGSTFSSPNGMRHIEPQGSNIGERHSGYQGRAPIAAPQTTFSNQPFDDRHSNYKSNQPETKPVVVVEVKEKQKIISSKLIIDKGSEMDRAQHQITYFNESYVGDSSARAKQFTESTRGLVKTKITDDEEEDSGIYLDQSIYVEASTESAIICGLSKQFERQKNDTDLNVFRSFIVVVKPIQCVEDVQAYIDNLRESSSFTQLATKIQSIAKSLDIKKNDDPSLVKYTNNVISFLSHIDRMFTETVNDFLTNKLQLDLTIDCFSEDVSELGEYLYHKYGTVYAQAYQQFESEVIDMVLESMDNDISEDIARRVVLADGLSAVMMPVNHSLTYVCMNERELGYKIEGKVAVIDRLASPNLYSIASSLPKHCKDREFPTMIDLLITADGAVYKLHRNYLVDNEFLISKA